MLGLGFAFAEGQRQRRAIVQIWPRRWQRHEENYRGPAKKRGRRGQLHRIADCHFLKRE